MKTVFLSLLFLIAVNVVFARKNKELEAAKYSYKIAIQNQDLQSATIFIYDILAHGGEDDWNDTLAFVYYQRNMSMQAINIANDRIQSVGDNEFLLMIRADSYYKTKNYQSSIEDYEDLLMYDLLTENRLFYTYELGRLNYLLQNYSTSIIFLKEVISNSESAQYNLKMHSDIGPVQVSYKAAAHNMMGMVFYENQEIENAKLSFEEAIKLSPDFLLPQNNINVLNMETLKKQ